MVSQLLCLYSDDKPYRTLLTKVQQPNPCLHSLAIISSMSCGQQPHKLFVICLLNVFTAHILCKVNGGLACHVPCGRQPSKFLINGGLIVCVMFSQNTYFMQGQWRRNRICMRVGLEVSNGPLSCQPQSMSNVIRVVPNLSHLLNRGVSCCDQLLVGHPEQHLNVDSIQC